MRLFNFEPVNAEDLLPTGTAVWERLVEEIASCDLFVLILGETYGDIPASGPGSGAGKSVTELEFDAAREAGVPVIVFTKRLGYGAPTDTEDARRRDAFRERVRAWEDGLFGGEFDLAVDLADQVGHALVQVLSDNYRTQRLAERRRKRDRSAQPSGELRHSMLPEWDLMLPIRPALRGPGPEASLPADLVTAVADRSAVLLVGAGVSSGAGLPSAAAFIEAMVERLRDNDRGYRPTASGTQFNAVASDYQALLGAQALEELAQHLIDPPYADQPTVAHLLAPILFNTVLTTNYDTLLERAIGDRPFEVIHREPARVDGHAAHRLFKLHGSIADPASLVMTEDALASLEETRPRVFEEVRRLLAERPLVAIGSSLRDPSLIRLLTESRRQARGWAVLPNESETERRRLSQWGIDLVVGDAEMVLVQLFAQIATKR